MKPDYDLLLPSRYLVVKDDITGFVLHTELVEGGSEHKKTVPLGYDYEVPLSLHAETNLSEFRAKEKTSSTSKVKSV